MRRILKSEGIFMAGVYCNLARNNWSKFLPDKVCKIFQGCQNFVKLTASCVQNMHELIDRLHVLEKR